MAASATLPTSGLVSFVVKTNGQELDSLHSIISLNITKGFHRPGSAKLVLMDGDPATGTFPIADSSAFEPGSTIEIAVGYDNATQLLFRGIVGGLALAAQDGSTLLTVMCQEEAGQAPDGPATAPFVSPADQGLPTAQAGANSPVPTPTPATEAVMLTYGQNVYSFWLDADAHSPTLLTGTVDIPGSPEVQPGSIVQLNGFGARFGGRAWVSQVVHAISGGGWRTQISLGFNEETQSQRPEA